MMIWYVFEALIQLLRVLNGRGRRGGGEGGDGRDVDFFCDTKSESYV